MEKSCSLIVHFDKGTPALATEIKEALEGNDIPSKIEALKKAIMLLLNGETIPQLFITVIRYVLTCDDHTVQKLLLLYLEITDKTDSRGKVLPEMILICQNLRNNLQSPNEFIRGVTLRFLCRINESEIVEPLIPSILSNLEHRHPFVRRNAVLAVMSVYKLPHGDQLLDSAPEIIEKFLASEQDASSKRNAFLMLFSCAQDRAVNYLFMNIDRIIDWGEQLQMVVLELIKKVCRNNKNEKGKYIKIIIALLSANSTAVVYECAGTLVSLSSAPTAIKAAASTYCQLLLSQSDNNVKLIVLDRLNELKKDNREIMVDMVMDVLRALSTPNHDIRRKTIDIALELITPKNIDQVVMMLKKEVVKTQSGEHEKNGEYRQMLVQAIHTCAIKFPEVASTVVHLLMDFLGDTNVASAMDVVVFVREIIETNPKLRVSIITRLLDTFYQIRAARVCSCALWIIGEYCLSLSEVESGIATIKQCLGDLPFYTISEDGEGQETSKAVQQVNATTVSSRRPAILADGTYATQSAALETAMSPPTLVQGSLSSIGNLRSLILSGDFFLGAVVACTLTKLILRLNSKLILPLLFAVIILLLIPLNTNFSNFFTIETFSNFLASFHEKSNHQFNNKQESNVVQSFKPSRKSSNSRYDYIGFKNIEDLDPSSINPLVLPELPQTSQHRAISIDASKCFPVDLPNNAITNTNCCPPLPSPYKFKDFKDYAPSNSPLRVRKPFHLIDEELIAKFEKGIALMKALPEDDPRSFYQQSKIHCAYCNGAYHQQYPFENLKVDIHRSWLFFPFHRMYLYFFERILGNLIGDPNFAIPFWSWDSIEGMQIPKHFTRLNSSLYHKLRDKNHMPPQVVDLNYKLKENYVSPNKQISFNLATMYRQMVLASTKELFMGSPLRLGDESHPGIGSVESAPHNTMHSWVGASETPNREDMGTFYTAARDPLFYPHHSNLDRMWVMWKNLGEGRKDYSDDLDWLESTFFFYDENANLVRVKIRDSIDTIKLGYVYEDVNMPWLNFKPTSKRKSKELREAKIAKILSSREKIFFPLVLDSIKSVIVKRPKKLRSKVEKEQEEEVLVIEGIEFVSDKSIAFDVHVDDVEDDLSDPDQVEFVGSFVSLHHGHNGKTSTSFKVGISKVLENLNVDVDDDLVVTLVPKVGEGEVTIGNIMIEFLPKY